MKEQTFEVKKRLGRLFVQTLKLSGQLYQLEMVREKLEGRTLQSFDKEDILGELGSLQHTIGELNSEMLNIYNLLKKEC